MAPVCKVGTKYFNDVLKEVSSVIKSIENDDDHGTHKIKEWLTKRKQRLDTVLKNKRSVSCRYMAGHYDDLLGSLNRGLDALPEYKRGRAFYVDSWDDRNWEAWYHGVASGEGEGGEPGPEVLVMGAALVAIAREYWTCLQQRKS